MAKVHGPSPPSGKASVSILVQVECPSRMSKSNVQVKCPSRMSKSNVQVECPSRMSKSNVLVECPSRISKYFNEDPRGTGVEALPIGISCECPTCINKRFLPIPCYNTITRVVAENTITRLFLKDIHGHSSWSTLSDLTKLMELP